MDINTYIERILGDARVKCERAKRDYAKGKQDCKSGQYDKWFRYHRDDDGHAYDMGWMEQNKTEQVANVRFLNA